MELDWDRIMNSAGGGAIIGGAIGLGVTLLYYGVRFIIRTFSGQSKTKDKSGGGNSRWG